MNEYILIFSLSINLLCVGGLVLVLLKQRKDSKKVEVQYFEYTEDDEGALRDSKRVTIKGQIFIDGLPVGGQYIVAERSFKKFDYDKLKEFKKEVVEPFAKAGLQMAQAINQLPDLTQSKQHISKLSNFFKTKP